MEASLWFFGHDEASARGRAIMSFKLLSKPLPESVVQMSETCTDCINKSQHHRAHPALAGVGGEWATEASKGAICGANLTCSPASCISAWRAASRVDNGTGACAWRIREWEAGDRAPGGAQ
jgi:hypothetical protein